MKSLKIHRWSITTIGAQTTIGPGVRIGRFAMIGMGALVTRDIGDFHLAIGHPAKPIGCVCRCGKPVARFDEIAPRCVVQCVHCRRRYEIDGTVVTESL